MLTGLLTGVHVAKMAENKNRHGLLRYVPAEVRRQLRKEAQFGCVKCGFAFCEYEHIDPEFADAAEHDPSKMAFLCKRCHGEVTSGRASKNSVLHAKKNPFCKTHRPAWKDDLEFGNLNSSIGSLHFFDCRTLLRVSGEDLLTIEPPEDDGGPIRVNAKIYDGPNPSLEIQDNALIIGQENWDVDIEGAVLTVRRSLGEPSLIYRFLPQAGIRIERISMSYKGIDINVDERHVSIAGHGCDIQAIAAIFQYCEACITATHNGFCFGDEPLPDKSLIMAGKTGGGVILEGLCISDTLVMRGGPLTLRDSSFPNGLNVHSGSDVRAHGCWIGRGIRIDDNASLQLVGGVVNGVRPR